MMRRPVLVSMLLIAAAGGVWLLWPAKPDLGAGRFFADRTYEFETLRVFDDIAAAGGDVQEPLAAISGLRAGDAEGWYAHWRAAGEHATALAEHTADGIARGHALLRAHTYYRSAEFFLPIDDARRTDIWRRNVTAFYQGLDALQVDYQRFEAPFNGHHLNAVYYPGGPGAATRPLLVMVNGYDGTMEELYLSFVAAALQRGFAVLTYEGPGQGAVLREQGVRFQPDWEKPNAAVLDAFLAAHAKPARIVLIGESLGGYLAPRAAAFEPRIDGVVAYDVWYDGWATATRHVPPAAFWLREHGYNRLLAYLASHNTDPGSHWAQENGRWVFGLSDSFAVLEAFKAYSLAPVADRIRAHVLLLAGADDHFVPAAQLDQFKASLIHAASVKAVLFDSASLGAEHCQIGAPTLWQSTLFDWLQETFPAA